MSDAAELIYAERTTTRARRRGQIGMAWLLAWRNLAHDRVRLLVTLVGVVFSVVLMAVQIGLLLGFARTASSLVDQAGVDFWITATGANNVDLSTPISGRDRFRALAVPGVAAAVNYVVTFAEWKRPDGGSENVNLVGFDLVRGTGGPWNLAEGSLYDLKIPRSVIIDRLYAAKLGVDHLGQVVEINAHRARVVGFTSGIRSFTQAPYVFTSLKNAHLFGGVASDQTKYILVSARPGIDSGLVRQRLEASLPDLEVWTAAAFSASTRLYWLLTTGIGIALIIGAALGLVVGTVIVAQTLYATTVDHLPEYATLRAMGAPFGYLSRVIVGQALMSAVSGYAIAIAIASGLVHAAGGSNVSLLLPPGLAALLFVLTLTMCAGGAAISLRRVARISPISVFR